MRYKELGGNLAAKATKKENPVLQVRPTQIFHFGGFFLVC